MVQNQNIPQRKYWSPSIHNNGSKPFKNLGCAIKFFKEELCENKDISKKKQLHTHNCY